METRKRTYTVNETANELGVSSWFVREAVRRGEMRRSRIGQRIMIPAAEIDRILSAPETGSGAVTSHSKPVLGNRGMETDGAGGG